ncbi:MULTISPECIES: PAS domain-containing sensor histidine kinase [unclassified Massilia]|uniref:PAS domain-containing sensor histidine kinase n=1 Tax=unclassified Massilia TaxID=2609279 RepID=UPI00177EBCB3|nr:MULTISPECIES: PAS domain-containing sensor histidine kinase [unclassified Massilia]MBD8532632.1 PAS domain S-box protein [Massilia sp. CFBP 13647]MBD8675993.1 PAS domain S-box protein [Massilia sp. CFBP 13721]
MNASVSNDGSGSAAVTLAEQFRVIAEIGGDIAFSIDCASGQLLYVSPAIEQLVGYTPAEVAAGLRPGESGPLAALCTGLPERMRRLRAGDRSRLRLVREAEFQGAHGYPVPVEIISSVLCDAAGRPQALVGLVRDLSPRRLREAEQKRFASMLNHEFRTPLSTIDGAIQRLEATCAHADEATRARYRKIAVATDRLIAMLDDYLSPERMAGIGSTRQPTSLAPRALLEEGLAQLRAAGRVASIKTRELPPTLRCEPEGLRLALKVLIDNAIAYSPPASPVELGGRLAASGIELAVRDHGPGVARDEQAHVFDKFYRGANAAGMPGSGLGLYMARSIVEVHGGVLSLVTPQGGGAEFRIWLPVAGARQLARQAASPDNPAPVGTTAPAMALPPSGNT